VCEKWHPPIYQACANTGMVQRFSNTVILYSHADTTLLTQTLEEKGKRQNKIGRGKMKENEGNNTRKQLVIHIKWAVSVAFEFGLYCLNQ